MRLPDTFQFSQAGLQDFVDCPMRFYLRYVRQVAWPAAEAEPIAEHERRMALGQTFHRMVQQHLVGIPQERLTPMATDPDLERWWRNYCIYRPVDTLPVPVGSEEGGPAFRYPENTLTTAIAGRRLIAKYDLIVVRPGKHATIFDWKTSPRRTQASTLKSRLQTCVYRYLLIRAGAYLNGGQPFAPEQIAMIYWFAEHPESPVHLPYDPAQFRDDESYLTGLIERIKAMPDEEFIRAAEEKRCQYCRYRSYCERGGEAGRVADVEEEFETEELSLLDFDFEQIAEIVF